MKTVEVVEAERPTILSPTKILDLLARAVLLFLLFTIRAGMFLAVLRTLLELRSLLMREDLSEAFKHVVLRALAILTPVEVYQMA